MTKTDGAAMAAHYNQTRDLSDFEGEAEPVEVRRDVTISVRFSADEIRSLRERADAAGTKVTAYIRAAALEADHPLDRDAVAQLADVVEQKVHQLQAALVTGR